MMPLLPAPSTFPASAGTSTTGTGTSARAGGTDLPGATAPGLFAELFASMLPGSSPRQEAEASVPSTTDPAEALAGAAADGQPAAESGDFAAAAPETPEATISPVPATMAVPEGLLLAQRAHYPSLASSEAAPNAAVPGATDLEAAEPGIAPPANAEISTPQPPGLHAGSDPLATGSAARTSFPVAVAPLLILPLPGAPTPESAAPEQVPPLPLAEAPLLVIELPESANPTPGAPELVDTSVEPGSPDARQTAPTAMLPATVAGTAPAQGAAPAANAPVVPEAEAATAGISIPAGEGTLSGAVPTPSAAGVALAEPAPPAVPSAPMQAHAIPVHAAAQATGQGTAAVSRPSTDMVVGAIDSIELPSTTAAPARTQTPPPLHRQLLGPIATLAAGPHGERTLSVNIAPEALGPIMVKAHLGSEGIRMDLSAPTEAGREALRAMLPELRRELAATGGGSITVGTSSEASATAGGNKGQEQTAGGEHRASAGHGSQPLPARAGQLPETPRQDAPLAQNAASHLDVMA